MEDPKLYGQMLGIKRPWGVERVELKLEDSELHFHLRHEEHAQWECAECWRV